jgi:hypothetical protein
MQYVIEGADASSGQDRTIIVSAIDEKDAHQQARSMNLMVSRVALHNAPVPSLGSAHSSPAVDYASPVPKSAVAMQAVTIPRYLGLQIASVILIASAAVCYGIAAIAVVVAISAATTPTRPPAFGGPPPGFMGLFSAFGFIGAFGFLSAGAIQHGLSAACKALRDIARNSWAK